MGIFGVSISLFLLLTYLTPTLAVEYKAIFFHVKSIHILNISFKFWKLPAIQKYKPMLNNVNPI